MRAPPSAAGRAAVLLARRRAAAAERVATAPAQGRLVASLRQQLEAQRAGNRHGFDKTHRHLVAQAVGLAGRVTDQRMGSFVITEEVIAERARRDEAVGAGLVELDEQARAGDAADMSLEG